MPPEERDLSLFPLNTVLFPATALPLQVFEERYKLMMQRCLEGDSTLGIVLIRSGEEVGEPAEHYDVGTTARIIQVNRVSEGRMFVSVFGQRRFRILAIQQRQPYISARVELLQEDVGLPAPPSLITAVQEEVAAYARLILGLRGGWEREVKAPEDPAALSYFAGGLLQVGLLGRQRLLEEQSVARRLEQASLLLQREIGVLRRRLAEERISRRFSRN